jgi:hypothetical protein
MLLFCSLGPRYGLGAGGVAYLDWFGDSYYSPAYIFPAQLGNGRPKVTADAISHEGRRAGADV